ncbi:MAG TPA: division plane positioning ATPase MipZ [Vitreimonas sp.]|uniref:division plane positioning ATPase MipZ n=1 Tax=Vitreimonas sp. TaxID=3069702 RepID=UPI002D620948|nr:division plane positioning ATPase MipZ [Vitreimonas sp.]HYD87938.1 division plane positioning ATPase MipZ [Vitreimonas sp.]
MSVAYAPAPSAALRQAHVIVVGNQKGGAGKSTVAMHLIVALMRMGRRTGALDLDVRQRSLTRYIENRSRWIADRAAKLPAPQILELRESAQRSLDLAEAEEEAAFRLALKRLSETCDFIVIDSPGGDSFMARLAHACADTLITPLNDSFVDFDLLGSLDETCADIVRPSIYSEMVWESRKRKALAVRTPIDWVVLRNRTSTSRIEAKNKQRVGDALKTLSQRIGFRLAPGLSERVIYRELFPQGLTMLDLDGDGGEGEMKMGHLAARQELRDLFLTLKLPGLEGEALKF